MFRKLVILAALLLLLAAAAGLIAQERREGAARRVGPPERQLRAENQRPRGFCPQCQCPRCQRIREGGMQQIRQRRRGGVEGMNRPFMAPGGPQRRFGGPQAPRDFGPQVGPRIRPQFGPQVGPKAGLPFGPQTGPQFGPQVGPQAGPPIGPQMGPQAGPPVGPQVKMPLVNEWFEQLKQAYRENDKEKMGLLIRKMEQVRNRSQQALPPQGPEGIRPVPEGRPGIERPLPQQQERLRQRGPQQDFEAPVIRPGAGPREQENMPVSPERQRRLRQGQNPEGDRPPREQEGPRSQNVPNPEKSDFPWY